MGFEGGVLISHEKQGERNGDKRERDQIRRNYPDVPGSFPPLGFPGC